MKLEVIICVHHVANQITQHDLMVKIVYGDGSAHNRATYIS